MAVGTDVAVVCLESVTDERERARLKENLSAHHKVQSSLIMRASLDPAYLPMANLSAEGSSQLARAKREKRQRLNSCLPSIKFMLEQYPEITFAVQCGNKWYSDRTFSA